MVLNIEARGSFDRLGIEEAREQQEDEHRLQC